VQKHGSNLPFENSVADLELGCRCFNRRAQGKALADSLTLYFRESRNALMLCCNAVNNLTFTSCFL
jgi:hypothetical protein